MSSAPELTFRYRSPAGAPALELFGLWQSQPASPAPEGLSFASGDAPAVPPEDAGGGYWQIDLPIAASAVQVEQLFQDRLSGLTEILNRLDAVPTRAQTILPERKNPPLPGNEAGSISFEAAAPAELPVPGSPEANLLAGIWAFGAGGPVAEGAAIPTSFALGDGVDWAAFQKGALDLLENAQRQLLYYAWVETAQEGQVLARSTVNWLGDLQTTWQQAVTLDQTALHQRSLTLALQSRAVTLKTAATLTTLAARIVMVFTLSGGLLVALPLAWKFINEIIRSIR